MKIKHKAKVIELMEEMKEEISGRIDSVDWDKPDADDKDENFNQAWQSIEEAIDSIKEIDQI